MNPQFRFTTTPVLPPTTTTTTVGGISTVGGFTSSKIGEYVEVNVGGRKFSTTLRVLQAIPLFKGIKQIPTLQTRTAPISTSIKQPLPFQQLQQPTLEVTSTVSEYLSLDEQGNLFIDLNPDVFEHILDWVRYNQNTELSIGNLSVKQLVRLKSEAAFYGLQDLSVACTKRLDELGQKAQQPLITTPSVVQPFQTSPVIPVIQPFQTTPLQTTSSNFQLLKLQVKNTNQTIVSVNPGIDILQSLPDSTVEFDLPQTGNILVEYSIADSCGDYVVTIDGVDQKCHPCLSGILFQELSEIKVLKFDYAMTQHLTFVSPISLNAGKHNVSLKWRPYQKTGYNIQGPIVTKVFYVHPSLVNIK